MIKAPIRDLKNYYGDIIATLNTGEIVNIEAYKTFTKREYNKSYNYMCRLYSNQLKEGNKNYEDTKKVISINLITGNYKRKNNELVNTYKMKNDLTNVILDNGELEMILIRLDMVNSIKYNESAKKLVRWLKLINAKNIKEMVSIAECDKNLEQSVEFVKRYLNGPLNHTIEDYIAEKELYAEERGEKIGEKRGILETAKNMLKKNLDCNLISEITNLSIEEINKLKKEI